MFVNLGGYELKRKMTLLIDSIVNLILGILLVFFPYFYRIIGAPESNTNFYPIILGAIFIGIAIALLIEAFKKEGSKFIGLGLVGAISINICGGIALTGFLVFGNLALPLRGMIFLWFLALVLLLISIIELIANIRGEHNVT